MFPSKSSLLPLLCVVHIASACVTEGYVPCLAPNAQAPVAPPLMYPSVGGGGGLVGGGFYSSVSSAAGDQIQVTPPDDSKRWIDERDDHELNKRQNSLCCKPAPVQCLYTGDVPFCYTPSTTRIFFSDGSYGFLSNETFYGADGTFIDYKNGIYDYPNGTEVRFTPASSANSSSSSSSASSPSTTSTGSSGGTQTSAAAAGTSSSASSSGAQSLSLNYKSMDVMLSFGGFFVVAATIFTTLC